MESAFGVEHGEIYKGFKDDFKQSFSRDAFGPPWSDKATTKDKKKYRNRAIGTAAVAGTGGVLAASSRGRTRAAGGALIGGSLVAASHLNRNAKERGILQTQKKTAPRGM